MLRESYKIIIIGAGFSGLCLGIKLKVAGIDDFLILEKAEDLGGTWRDNTYPGAECDIPSALYSYSFEHNSEWEYKWSGQEQILKYQRDTAGKYAVLPHIRYGQELVHADFAAHQLCWHLTTGSGTEYRAQHLVTAVGQLHHPNTPKFPGAEAFAGEIFHSARWNHALDLHNKRVAVIGNAASAVQFVPKIAPVVKQLTVFQRSANWLLPKQDRPYTRWEQWLSERVPLITKGYRLGIWLKGEWGILPAIRGNRLSRWVLKWMNRRLMHNSIGDEKLRQKLTPDYPIGAKRILFTDDYYAALARGNVHLDTSGIERFTEHGIARKDGVKEPFDVVIYATGFRTNPFLETIKISGLNGKSLQQHWQGGAYAYLGVNTAGFPNLHIMYGPNTNLGHNSIIIMIEAQADYILQAVKGVDERGAAALTVTANNEERYCDEMQSRLQDTAFSAVADSWYLDHGRVTNNWPAGTGEYRRRLRRLDWQAYNLLYINES